MKSKIHPDLIPYFKEIANRLYSEHAAVMIGAGFSRNAQKNSPVSKGFPDWNQLGDIFYEKVSSCSVSDDNECNYRNVLRLADEVEAAFGRSVLNNILRTEIPDKQYQPSELHEKLLKLPWVDVFTTNYDTLLERAAEKILERRYETVINKEDLIDSGKPRIIKLHGSFPSERPFIITEEDYRKYSKDYAPFVNTVQQALIENTFCLLGFSGTDPNFLQWVGWIRDNLGKNSPKIYLIGILNISSAQKKLLEKQNVIPLDLSICEGVDNNHECALSLFIDFLLEKGEKDDRLNWPQKNVQSRYFSDQDNLSKVPEVLENWKENRKEFPNWLIVPEDRRNVLTSYTDDSYIFHLSEIESPTDIQFLYEYNWRIEKCLVPIYNHLIPHYEKVINKYNPFPDKLIIENAFTPLDNKFDWNEITPQWIELQLAIMRNFREEEVHEKWHYYNERIHQLIDKLNPETQARYYYERCLYALFSLDIPKLKSEMQSWPINNSLPYWEAKRAGLLTEIGELAEAEIILESSLIEVRSRLNLSPVKNDYSNISQEAYLLLLLKYCKDSKEIVFEQLSEKILPENEKSVKESFSDKIVQKVKPIKNQETFGERQKRNEEYRKKWEELNKYKCNPLFEHKIFELQLDREPYLYKSEEKIIEFDVNLFSTSYNLGGTHKYAEKAYSFLRFKEEIGIPLRFDSNISRSAIKHIAKYSPFWAFINFIRLGDTKLIDHLFDRKTILGFNVQTIDNKIEEYLNILERSKEEIINEKIPLVINLAKVIPEILSRLCIKSSFETRLKIFDKLIEIYNCDHRDRYRGIKKLIKRLLNSFSESERFKILPQLFEFPVLPELHNLIEGEYADPFDFFRVDKKKIRNAPKINIPNETIQTLFEFAHEKGKERAIALKRLLFLWELRLLTKKQTDQLSTILWSRIDDKNGFPTDLNYFNFSYLGFPHPKSTNPKELLRDYINKFEIPIQANKEDKSISITRGYIQEFSEIIGASQATVSYTWEKEDINTLAQKVIVWWDADKHYLKDKSSSHFFGSKKDEFKARFKNLTDLYAELFQPNYHLLEKTNQEELKRILDEFEEYELNACEAYAAFYFHYPERKDKTYLKIYNGLFSKSEYNIRDTLSGVVTLIELKADVAKPLVLLVSEQIRNRSEIELDSFLDVIALVVKKYPDLLNENILSNIEFGLINLIEETKISKYDSAEIVNNKISIRVQTAKLSVALNTYFSTNGDYQIQEYINQWKELCLDKNEFSEIRRIWIDSIN